MRALGLVFDVTIAADVLDVGDPADRAFAITSDDSPVPVVSPWTRFTIGGNLFRASESPASLLRHGISTFTAPDPRLSSRASLTADSRPHPRG